MRCGRDKAMIHFKQKYGVTVVQAHHELTSAFILVKISRTRQKGNYSRPGKCVLCENAPGREIIFMIANLCKTPLAIRTQG